MCICFQGTWCINYHDASIECLPRIDALTRIGKFNKRLEHLFEALW